MFPPDARKDCIILGVIVVVDIGSLEAYIVARMFRNALELTKRRKNLDAPARRHGIYRGDMLDVKGKFKRFHGKLQFHGAEVTFSGERFSLVWYSVGAQWLKKLSEDDCEEISSYRRWCTTRRCTRCPTGAFFA